MTKNIQRSVYITPKQNDWLVKNPSIKLSGLVREAIDERMRRK